MIIICFIKYNFVVIVTSTSIQGKKIAAAYHLKLCEFYVVSEVMFVSIESKIHF